MRERERPSHVFDAAGYIGDLAAAGVKVMTHKGALFLHCGPEGGFGHAFGEVQARYADAMDADPDYLARITALAPVYRDGDPL